MSWWVGLPRDEFCTRASAEHRRMRADGGDDGAQLRWAAEAAERQAQHRREAARRGAAKQKKR
jgi:hypothetical protein